MTKEEVLNLARLVLNQCDGAVSRDEKGYDSFDAGTIRQMLSPDIHGIVGLEIEEVEYLREKLTRYKKQIRDIATAHGIPQNRIDDVLKRLDEPLSEVSLICRGQIRKGTPYGRISFKWVKEHFCI